MSRVSKESGYEMFKAGLNMAKHGILGSVVKVKGGGSRAEHIPGVFVGAGIALAGAGVAIVEGAVGFGRTVHEIAVGNIVDDAIREHDSGI